MSLLLSVIISKQSNLRLQEVKDLNDEGMLEERRFFQDSQFKFERLPHSDILFPDFDDVFIHFSLLVSDGVQDLNIRQSIKVIVPAK